MPKCNKCGSDEKAEAKCCARCGTTLWRRLCANGHVMEPEWGTCRYCPSHLSGAPTRVIQATRVVTPLKPVSAESTAANIKQAGRTQLYTGTKEEKSLPLIGWLVITEGKDQWRDYRIASEQVVLGRDHGCDIVIDDSRASARHASVRVREANIFITDLDSSNGTFVNGAQIDRTELEDGAQIKVGDTLLKFKRF